MPRVVVWRRGAREIERGDRMMDVTTTVEARQVRVWRWECVCGAQMKTEWREPEGEDLYCGDCQERRHEEAHEKYLADFREREEYLFGAVVIGVVAEDDYWYEWPDAGVKADIRHIVVQVKDGTRYKITPGEPSFLCVREVEE